jgi:hypothetical protein
MRSGTPTPGQSLVYSSVNNQWQFALASGSGLTGPSGSTATATTTSLGTVQLSGILTGTATSPQIKDLIPNMSTALSSYNIIAQRALYLMVE